MEVDCLPYTSTGYYSKLICDYLDEKEELKPFYNRFPHIDNFEDQIKEKSNSFTSHQRKVLVEALTQQYKNVALSDATKQNIQLLEEEKTFTIVTGHQLNLFTGPLYFLYKIISTINLTTALKERYPDYNFVPVYWMATEDHDFKEINYFNFEGKKVHWNKDVSGAVGPLDTKGLEEVATTFFNQLGSFKNAETIKRLFTEAYLQHATLTEATRFLANELFKAYGLVIIDGDDTLLKRELVPYMKQDIFQNVGFKNVTESITALEALPEKYGVQVNPREINYFYLQEGVRERIVELDGVFSVIDTDYTWTAKQLEEEIEAHPERFSPNVVARPLYQEVILPNLCYIGGGGELAYWLELKKMFKAVDIPFPILLLRNSVLLISEKSHQKLKNMQLSVADLFLKQSSFINKKIREISNIDIDFSTQKNHLKEQFAALYTLAEQTDKSFLGAVKAQEVKQLKGLEHLEKRLLSAQKRKLKDQVVRMTDIQNELFPNQSLQERQENFSSFYLELGENLIPSLIETLKPLSQDFTVLKY